MSPHTTTGAVQLPPNSSLQQEAWSEVNPESGPDIGPDTINDSEEVEGCNGTTDRGFCLVGKNKRTRGASQGSTHHGMVLLM